MKSTLPVWLTSVMACTKAFSKPKGQADIQNDYLYLSGSWYNWMWLMPEWCIANPIQCRYVIFCWSNLKYGVRISSVAVSHAIKTIHISVVTEESNVTDNLVRTFCWSFWTSMTRKIPYKINLHTCQVIVVCGVLTAIPDCGLNTTNSSKPCRVSPHIVRRRAVVLKRTGVKLQASINIWWFLWPGGYMWYAAQYHKLAHDPRIIQCYPASQYLGVYMKNEPLNQFTK